jgi:hypothetical protein
MILTEKSAESGILMKKIFTIFTVMLITAAILCGCGSGVVVQNETKRQASTGQSWTVMIYMCGSTLEEEYAAGSNVLSSLAYDLPENINAVVETGGSRLWNTADVDIDYQQDYEVQKNGIRLVNQSPSKNMGESGTLSDFLSWGIKNYPADRYAAIIWDHGAGPIGGVGFDSIHDYDSLTLPEIKSALGSIGVKLDIIGFDASLMSNIETASALSLYADYLVASEDVMPESGWDYNGLFTYLSENPNAETAQVGAVICDGAAAKAAESAEQPLISMAVSDLSQTSNLSLQFDGMARTMNAATDDLFELASVVGAADNLEYLGGNSAWEGYSNMADLNLFVEKAAQNHTEIVTNIKTAIESMVVYKNMSEYHAESCGLGVYYPRHRDGSMISSYRNICASGSYMAFLEKTCKDVDIDGRQYTPENGGVWDYYNGLAYENIMTAAPDLNGRYVLSATHPDIFTQTAVNFYMYNAKAAGYLYLFSDYQTRYDDSVGGYVYEFSGRLPMLNSTPVSMELVSSTDLYDIYSIPVIYDGEQTVIRVVKTKTADNYGEYKILGVWKGVDKYTGMAQRTYKKLGAGDVIIPIYRMYGKSEEEYIEGNKIRIGFGGVKLTEKKISDGDYIISYKARDVYGAEYECDTNNLEVIKGDVKIMEY